MTHSLTQHVVHDAHTALPAWTGLFGTCQDASVEVEHLLIHLVAQHRTSRIQNLPLQPVLQHLHRRISQHSQRLLHRLWLTHREGVNIRQALYVEVGLPVETGILLREVHKRHLMIVRGRVTQCHMVTSSLSHTYLQRHDVLHLLLCSRRRFTHKLEHLHDMLPVSLQNLLVRLIILHVVVTLQRVATLRDFQDVLRRFHHVGTHIAAPQLTKANTLHVHLIDQCNQLRSGLHRRHTLQINHHRCHTLLVLTHRIHPQGIEVANLLTERTLRLRLLCQSLDNLADALLVLLSHHIETAVSCKLRTQRIVLHPTATGILIEVRARLCSRIHIFQLNAHRLSIRHS